MTQRRRVAFDSKALILLETREPRAEALLGILRRIESIEPVATRSTIIELSKLASAANPALADLAVKTLIALPAYSVEVFDFPPEEITIVDQTAGMLQEALPDVPPTDLIFLAEAALAECQFLITESGALLQANQQAFEAVFQKGALPAALILSVSIGAASLTKDSGPLGRSPSSKGSGPPAAGGGFLTGGATRLPPRGPQDRNRFEIVIETTEPAKIRAILDELAANQFGAKIENVRFIEGEEKTPVFDFCVSVVSGVIGSLLAAFLYDRFKKAPGTRLRVNSSPVVISYSALLKAFSREKPPKNPFS